MALVKCLSVKQPWADMFVREVWGQQVKTIETRKWYTDYRGDLLLVSSKNATGLRREVFPMGVSIVMVNLYDCVPMAKEHEHNACCDVYDGAWAWLTRNPRPVNHLPIKGQLGIFTRELSLKELGL